MCDGVDVLHAHETAEEESELRLSIPQLRDPEQECVLLLHRGHREALSSQSVITET